MLAFVATLLAGCGLTSSPADNLTFTAPQGWLASPGILGYAQFWHPAAETDEALILFRSPRTVDTNQVFQNARLKNARIDTRREIQICGNQRAVYVKGEAESNANGADSRPHNLEMTIATTNGNTYFAMYVYPLHVAPNAQAEAALRELCTKH